MLLWGIICLVFVKVVYPFLCKLIYKIPYEKGMNITKVLLVIILVDMFISFGAVIRQNLRRENIPAYTPIGEFFDKYYDDERLKKAYPNMKVKVKK